MHAQKASIWVDENMMIINVESCVGSSELTLSDESMQNGRIGPMSGCTHECLYGCL